MRLAVLSILSVAVTLPATADTLRRLDDRWMRYENHRFGTILDFPSSFKPVDPPPENGDGGQFRDDGGSTLLVFGSYAGDALMIGFDDYKQGLVDEAKREGLEVTYEKTGKGWIVFSGRRNGKIVYTKLIAGCGAAHEFTIEYPSDKKKASDRIVARMSRSLRCRTPKASG